ncbi:MAG: hypothetical protein HOI59_04545 [Nitrospina sp.]|nr:hypothetical protein [Nitrospina sp.]MBT3857406.1 hypothetical protein [Nitrospina sp.]MBT4103984.1 hypothetical protein [Nitrospina sp.]MBT4389617.1 hypothetical protein [Nitrospina sp.]MBT4620744.1 hypothetical protein [Nitrospina sp.]
MAKPFADLTARYFLDSRIRKNITHLKNEQPDLILGETHCHSTFSDGSHSVQNILKRAAFLGLDYVVITDHLIPGKFLIETIVASLKEQAQCINEWDETTKPIKAYPAFEISTMDGHLIIILDPEYLSLEKVSDISLQFSDFDYQFVSMLDVIPRIEPFGGISIVPHPEKKKTHPFGASIKWVKENLTGLVDGIEDISSGHGYQESYSQELGLASIGSSDDHFNLLMGTAVTAYDGNIHNSLISAVKARQTKAISVESSLQHLLTIARRVI